MKSGITISLRIKATLWKSWNQDSSRKTEMCYVGARLLVIWTTSLLIPSVILNWVFYSLPPKLCELIQATFISKFIIITCFLSQTFHSHLYLQLTIMYIHFVSIFSLQPYHEHFSIFYRQSSQLSLRSCTTHRLCDPIDCSPPGSSIHGILQARILEWVAMPPQGIFPTQWLNSGLLRLLHWQLGS